MALDKMIDLNNKFCVALKNNVSAAMVSALNTPESNAVMKYYRSHGYWFSEMYDFVPKMRKPLRAVLEQLGITP